MSTPTPPPGEHVWSFSVRLGDAERRVCLRCGKRDTPYTMNRRCKLPRVSQPRRKHSRDGSVRCDLCSPLRCSKAP